MSYESPTCESPTLFTGVYRYKDWIESNMKEFDDSQDNSVESTADENIEVKVTVFENPENKVYGFYEEL